MVLNRNRIQNFESEKNADLDPTFWKFAEPDQIRLSFDSFVVRF